MFRRGVSILVMLGYLAGQSAAVPHAAEPADLRAPLGRPYNPDRKPHQGFKGRRKRNWTPQI